MRPMTPIVRWVFGGLLVTLWALLVTVWAASAFADSTIDGLSAGSAIVGTESIPMFQTANPAVKTTPDALDTYLSATTKTLSNKIYTGTSATLSGLVQAGTTLGISTDALLNRDAAGILAQRNGANAQILRVYKTYTSGSVGAWTMLDAGVTAADTLTLGSRSNGGATGMTKIDILVDGTRKLDYGASNASAWTVTGNLVTLSSAYFGQANYFGTNGRSLISSPADGDFTLSNNGGSGGGFLKLQFGGATSSFPALKRSTTTIQVRLADDSNYAPIAASAYSAGATAGVSCSGAPTAGFASVNGIVTAC